METRGKKKKKGGREREDDDDALGMREKAMRKKIGGE